MIWKATVKASATLENLLHKIGIGEYRWSTNFRMTDHWEIQVIRGYKPKLILIWV